MFRLALGKRNAISVGLAPAVASDSKQLNIGCLMGLRITHVNITKALVTFTGWKQTTTFLSVVVQA